MYNIGPPYYGPVLTSKAEAQRRSQVSLAGGADRIPGGGINLNTYSYGKKIQRSLGGLKFFRGGADAPPLAPPPRGYGPAEADGGGGASGAPPLFLQP